MPRIQLDVDAELLAGRFADHAGIPGGLPDYLNVDVAHFREGANPLLHLLGNLLGRRATLRGKGHFDGDVAGVVVLDVVDQPQVNDIDGDFRVVALAHG